MLHFRKKFQFQHLSHREYWICYVNKVKASFTFRVLTEYICNHAFIFCTYLIFNLIPNSVESLLFDKVYYKFFFLILCHHAQAYPLYLFSSRSGFWKAVSFMLYIRASNGLIFSQAFFYVSTTQWLTVQGLQLNFHTPMFSVLKKLLSSICSLLVPHEYYKTVVR